MIREPDGGEQAFVETPFMAQGEAVPSPPALLAGPFRRIVLANLFGSLAFWSFYGAVFWESANRYGADQAGMAVIGAALSVPFILGSLIQGLVVDRWSPKWLLVIGYLALLAAVTLALIGDGLPWLWGSSFMVGAAFATIEPSRSALTGLLVAPERLVSANGAMATSFQAGARRRLARRRVAARRVRRRRRLHAVGGGRARAAGRPARRPRPASAGRAAVDVAARLPRGGHHRVAPSVAADPPAAHDGLVDPDQRLLHPRAAVREGRARPR